MKALDLFCGIGGASWGLSLAGFQVHGVDIAEQRPGYPFPFTMENALTVDLDGYDFVWASPPCQHFTKYQNCRKDLKYRYENLIVPVRQKLQRWGGPYIIENVVGAPLEDPVMLCGSMFGLDIRRHRLFESNRNLVVPKCNHSIWEPNRFPGGRSRERGGPRVKCRGTIEIGRWNIPIKVQKDAMEMPWVMDKDLRRLSEAVPPAYSKFLGSQIRARQEAKEGE